MKRPIKPFVVEVRKGQKVQTKKTPVVDLLPMGLADEQPRESDALRRAELALFGGAPKSDMAGSSGRSGRILESIPEEDEAQAPVEAATTETKRRGRPPGSRNKPREIVEAAVEAPAEPRRRGRPPRNLEGVVRKVELTPELASAALASIAKARVARPLAPIMSAKAERVAPGSTRPKREPRPANPEKLLARQAKLEARQAKLLARQEKQKARQAPVRSSASKAIARLPVADRPSASAPLAVTSRPASPLDTLPRLIRIGLEARQSDPVAREAALQRPRAGERWRRRLRGAAFFAYERRTRKTSVAPR
jgi:hypothetical protein